MKPTHCKKGHEFTSENTFVKKSNGTRQCRICLRGQWKSRYQAKRIKVNGKYTHCLEGHEFTEENTYYNPSGHRLCRICKKNYSLRKNYGIDKETWERMYNHQKGSCALCGKAEVRLVVDHDHSTGKVRSLLCTSCNFALGAFRDNPDLLEKAKEYLRKHA